MKEEKTTDLLSELIQMDDDPKSLKKYIKERSSALTFESLKDYFNYYLAMHPDIQISDVINRANADKNYAYQIFNGRKAHPGKYILTAICIALGMSYEETQRSLVLAEQPTLSPKINLDAALIVCINNGYKDMVAVNEYLIRVGLEPV